jgi:hypothetical protein
MRVAHQPAVVLKFVSVQVVEDHMNFCPGKAASSAARIIFRLKGITSGIGEPWVGVDWGDGGGRGRRSV